jgi:hypothetical protein
MLNAGEHLEGLAVRALVSDGRDWSLRAKPSFGNERQSCLDDDLREDRFHFDLGGT